MVYLLAKFGLYGCIQFLELNEIYLTSAEPEYDENWYRFFCGKNIHISVPKVLYDNDQMTQSIIGTIILCVKRSDTLRDIEPLEYWVDKIAESFNFKDNKSRKGFTSLQSIEMLFDKSTQAHVQLPYEDKQDVYHLIRWMMREFNALVSKSYYSLVGKRVRLAEYIASIYA